MLQNQSQVPGWKLQDVTNLSLPYAILLADRARSSNAGIEVTYFQTWGRRDGDSQNCGYYPLVCTFVGHTQALADGYGLYESNTGDDIAPVGWAWKDVVESASPPFDPNSLWSGDGSHPSARGSYLAALIIYQQLFHTSATGNPFTAGLDGGDVTFLQGIASP